MDLLTIGYEGTDLETFFGVLARSRVRVLVDVRETPLSRKPGFSKTALAQECANNSIKYLHVASLGCPKRIRSDYAADKNWAKYARRFKRHLEDNLDSVERLSRLAHKERACLVCFEADYNFCHRSIVAAAVEQRSGIRTKHLSAIAEDPSEETAPVFA